MSWEQDGVVKRCRNPDSSNRQMKLSGALELCLLALKIGLKIADLMASYTAALFTSCDNDLVMMTCLTINFRVAKGFFNQQLILNGTSTAHIIGRLILISLI